MEYFIDALKKYADFKGRARRKEYWMFVLIYSIIIIALSLIDTFFGTVWLSPIFSLALIIPSISISARRLHDIGRSGWWQLIYFIPLIGLIVMLVFLCQDSHEENHYGISPKFA
jgi:uncharacterized membrane protein YhaH (DUF805 family)